MKKIIAILMVLTIVASVAVAAAGCTRVLDNGKVCGKDMYFCNGCYSTTSTGSHTVQVGGFSVTCKYKYRDKDIHYQCKNAHSHVASVTTITQQKGHQRYCSKYGNNDF